MYECSDICFRFWAIQLSASFYNQQTAYRVDDGAHLRRKKIPYVLKSAAGVYEKWTLSSRHQENDIVLFSINNF